MNIYTQNDDILIVLSNFAFVYYICNVYDPCGSTGGND